MGSFAILDLLFGGLMEQLDPWAEQALRRELAGKVVLLLEDLAEFAAPIVDCLKRHGVARVDHFVLGEAALEAALARPYDVLLLDRQNPGMEGLQVLSEIRRSSGPSRNAPALMVTVFGGEDKRNQGMLLGADDYLVKPIKEIELVSRIVARFRRTQQLDAVLVNGPLMIDTAANTVSLAGEALTLTPKERGILTILARSVGLPVTKSMIFRQVWPNQSLATTGWENTMMQRVATLRQNLKAYEVRHLPKEVRPMILNIKGEGYLLRDLGRVVPLEARTP